jgi:hypothetical protein
MPSAITLGLGFTPSTKPASTSPTTASTHGMRRSYLVLGQVLRGEILQGLLAIEALPDEPAGEREAMVGIAPRALRVVVVCVASAYPRSQSTSELGC